MSTGYQPLASSPDQDEVLAAIEERAEPGAVCVFDLDGCLFDTRYRQVHLYAQLGALIDAPCLARVRVDHFQDWDPAATLRQDSIDRRSGDNGSGNAKSPGRISSVPGFLRPATVLNRRRSARSTRW